MPFFYIDHRVSSDRQYEHSRTGVSAARPSGESFAVVEAGVCLRSCRPRSRGLQAKTQRRVSSIARPRSLLSALKLMTSGSSCVPYERPANESVGVPMPHRIVGLQVANYRHVLVEPAMRDDRPYFFSIEGKYEAGPCFGQGAVCSAPVTVSLSDLESVASFLPDSGVLDLCQS